MSSLISVYLTGSWRTCLHSSGWSWFSGLCLSCLWNQMGMPRFSPLSEDVACFSICLGYHSICPGSESWYGRPCIQRSMCPCVGSGKLLWFHGSEKAGIGWLGEDSFSDQALSWHQFARWRSSGSAFSGCTRSGCQRCCLEEACTPLLGLAFRSNMGAKCHILLLSFISEKWYKWYYQNWSGQNLWL